MNKSGVTRKRSQEKQSDKMTKLEKSKKVQDGVRKPRGGAYTYVLVARLQGAKERGRRRG